MTEPTLDPTNDPKSPLFEVNDWVQTHSGKVFRFTDPRPESILIEDIAHALSMLCRFAGHVKSFYSVGQHSIVVANLVNERCEDERMDPATHRGLVLAALLHDASEAYCVDLPRPIKNRPELAGYKAIERRVEQAVMARFGVGPEYYDHPWIKWADNRALATEVRDLLNTPDQKWGLREQPMEEKIVPSSDFETIQLQFLAAFASVVSMPVLAVEIPQ